MRYLFWACCAFVFIMASHIGFAEDALTVVVTTDKATYAVKEPVQVKILNRTSATIFCHAVSGTPTFFIDAVEQRSADGTWQALPVRCHWPECDIDFDGPGPLDPGKEASFSWTPVRHDKALRQDFVLGPGTYRLVGGSQIRPLGTDSHQWTTQEIRSNEFEIRKE